MGVLGGPYGMSGLNLSQPCANLLPTVLSLRPHCTFLFPARVSFFPGRANFWRVSNHIPEWEAFTRAIKWTCSVYCAA